MNVMVLPRSVSALSILIALSLFLSLLSLSSCGGSSGGSGGGGGGGGNPPGTPSGLTATPGNAQVSLTWNAVTTASSYNVKRAATSGGPYTQLANASVTNYTDSGLTNGTTYYYVASAKNSSGESSNSSEASATPVIPVTGVQVTIDVLANRHAISPYIYGGAYPKDAATITDSGLSVVRWGGNATSQYNWMTHTSNSANDWYFSDYTYKEIGESDSVKFVQDANAAGTNPLISMVMLDWVSRGDPATGTDNGQLYSFSRTKYGAQCAYRPDNPDAGNGQKTDCSTNVTGNDFNDAHVPIFDDNSTPCPGSALGPCVYRTDWATALAAAFGASPHFYDMDNEIDIWGGTHHDVHPNPTGYDEMRDTYLRVARGLKTWDPAAVRLGPVSCCWWFYWNGADANDKGNHAGIDLLPWWLNEVYWQDKIAGTRSLDLFDIHAYPDGPDLSALTLTQKQALAVSIYRDYWDPTYTSPSGTINQPWTTQIQPKKETPFRIPRMRAIVNAIYPDTPLAITEWSAEFAGGSDFSTALGDADAYGLLGRERVYLASRWVAPDSANPNYQALKLYTRNGGGFAPISVSASNTGNPNLFSSYAAVNAAGTTMTVMIINKDPQKAAEVTFNFSGFTPSTVATYTLAATAPNTIAATPAAAWASPINVAPYSATLLVITGATGTLPSAEWDLNPDTIMVPAGGTVTLSPTITNGSGNVTLGNAAFDAYEGAAACPGSLSITTAGLSTSSRGAISVTASSTPGFCHFTVSGTDGTARQKQGGWIVVGNPAATLATTTGDAQTGNVGAQLPIPLTLTLTPGQSGGTASGASVLIMSSGGLLSDGTHSGTKLVVVTSSSGITPAVSLTLPSTAGPVTVTAEGPYGLGHPIATFTESAQ